MTESSVVRGILGRDVASRVETREAPKCGKRDHVPRGMFTWTSERSDNSGRVQVATHSVVLFADGSTTCAWSVV